MWVYGCPLLIVNGFMVPVIAISFRSRILEKLEWNFRRGLRNIEDVINLVFHVDICADQKKIEDRLQGTEMGHLMLEYQALGYLLKDGTYTKLKLRVNMASNTNAELCQSKDGLAGSDECIGS